MFDHELGEPKPYCNSFRTEKDTMKNQSFWFYFTNISKHNGVHLYVSQRGEWIVVVGIRDVTTILSLIRPNIWVLKWKRHSAYCNRGILSFVLSWIMICGLFVVRINWLQWYDLRKCEEIAHFRWAIDMVQASNPRTCHLSQICEIWWLIGCLMVCCNFHSGQALHHLFWGDAYLSQCKVSYFERISWKCSLLFRQNSAQMFHESSHFRDHGV